MLLRFIWILNIVPKNTLAANCVTDLGSLPPSAFDVFVQNHLLTELCTQVSGNSTV